MLLIAELGDLKPVAYIDHQGKEYGLLAASKVIDSLTSQKNNRHSLPSHQKKESLWRALTFGIATQLKHFWQEITGVTSVECNR
ncbi:hypothetical protein PS15p_200983 [Mucor circinelloides]